MVSVKVDAAGTDNDGATVIHPMEHQSEKRRIAANSRRGDVDKNLGSGTASGFVNCPPTLELKFSRRGRRRGDPFEIPVSNALLAVETGTGAHQFVSHASLQALWEVGSSGCACFNSRYLKFRGHNLRENT